MKRLVINLNNAEEMKKSYTSPVSCVIKLESELMLDVTSNPDDQKNPVEGPSTEGEPEYE